jgi:hypothetical protein
VLLGRAPIRKVLLSLIVVGLAGEAAGVGTYAAFSGTTANSGDSFTAGTVSLSDNDSGSAMYSVSNAKPGDSAQSCITVTYGGSLSANVRLYTGSSSGSLGSYLTLVVQPGHGTVSFGSTCTNFVADGSAIYNGTLSSFASTYTNFSNGLALKNTNQASLTWSQNDAVVYKFTISLNNDNNAQGLSSTATYTWEAQNT